MKAPEPINIRVNVRGPSSIERGEPNTRDEEDCEACSWLTDRPCRYHRGFDDGYRYAVGNLSDDDLRTLKRLDADPLDEPNPRPVGDQIDHPEDAADHALAAQAWITGVRSCTNYIDDRADADKIDALTAIGHALTSLALTTEPTR